MSNNIDNILAMRAQTLRGNNNYSSVPNNDNPEAYQEPTETKSAFLQPLNLCLLISTVIMLFIIFLLIVIYK
jgi:hypothetical protein